MFEWFGVSKAAYFSVQGAPSPAVMRVTLLLATEALHEECRVLQRIISRYESLEHTAHQTTRQIHKLGYNDRTKHRLIKNPRISRFLRAIGDPASRSKFGLWTQDDESGAGKSNVDGVVHRGRTDEGRKRSRAAGVHRAGHDSGLSSLVEDKGGQETEVEEEEEDLQGGAERRAIFDLFRAVDIDASGRISQEELITTVRGGVPQAHQTGN